jgi:hypothetical protein
MVVQCKAQNVYGIQALWYHVAIDVIDVIVRCCSGRGSRLRRSDVHDHPPSDPSNGMMAVISLLHS